MKCLILCYIVYTVAGIEQHCTFNKSHIDKVHLTRQCNLRFRESWKNDPDDVNRHLLKTPHYQTGNVFTPGPFQP